MFKALTEDTIFELYNKQYERNADKDNDYARQPSDMSGKILKRWNVYMLALKNLIMDEESLV